MQCKQYRMGLLCRFFNNKNLFHLKKRKRIKKTKKQEDWFSVKQDGFFSTLIISQSVCDFSLLARSRTGHITISLIGRASYTCSIGPWY